MAATGKDAHAIKGPFALHPDQYILSGGPRPTDPIVVDDDVEVTRGGGRLFLDDDHARSSETRPRYKRTYDGSPLILALRPGAKFRVRATDHVGGDAELGDLYLHRFDGAKIRLVAARKERSNPRLPHVFFDQEFDLAGRFPAAGPARPAGNALTGRQLEALWADLADADKGKGYLAHWALAADPRQALPFLRSRVRPAQLDGQLRQRVGRLIGQLDSDECRRLTCPAALAGGSDALLR